MDHQLFWEAQWASHLLGEEEDVPSWGHLLLAEEVLSLMGEEGLCDDDAELFLPVEDGVDEDL
ncbi:hypothetical protein D6779_09630 [Candidatus Parcubacteria bacterium]|nr:MAG: hypothetical protein D6779_09630 [Candidatus Parcubacteria bacterium]